MQPSLFDNIKFLHPVGVSTFKYGVTIPLEAQTERLRAIEKGSKVAVTSFSYGSKPIEFDGIKTDPDEEVK